MRKPTDEQVADAIKALPMELRRPFVMAHVQRKLRCEIAAELRISEAEVDARLTKALVACQANLEWHPLIVLLRWIATPPALLLAVTVHVAYIATVRACAFLGRRAPRPWLH